MLTNQQIFDKALTGIRAQGGFSFTSKVNMQGHKGVNCQYRHHEGRKCGVGHIILDEHYRPELETKSTTAAEVIAALIASGVDMGEVGHLGGGSKSASLLRAIQSAHDDAANQIVHMGVTDTEGWESRMAAIAHTYDLTYSAPVPVYAIGE